MNTTSPKPRLLSVNNYHYRRGGAEAVYLDHASLFESMGWENAFFSMHHPQNLESKWSEYFVDEIELGNDYSWWDKAKMAAKVINSGEAARKISSLIDNWRPDVVHAHGIYHHLSPSILPAISRAGIPVVLTAHDLKLACPAYKMMNSNGVCESCKSGNFTHLLKNRCIHGSVAMSGLVMLEAYFHGIRKTYLNNLTKITTPSQFFKSKLVEWGWPEAMIEYVPNFIELDNYQPNYQPGKYFLYFGRLSAEKGVETLIKACAQKGYKLVVAGSGPIEHELKALAANLGAEVDFKGFCSGDTLFDLVKQSRAIVLPSEWYENAPISILEAYALGKIVIGADIGGIPEMIEPERTGFLFDSGDVEQLVGCLEKVYLGNDSDIEKMGRQAREFMELNYGKEKYLNQMVGLYEAIGVRTPVQAIA